MFILFCASFAHANVLVLAAASSAPAITEIAKDFETRTNISVRISAGSSGTLARQISLGAPADVYISAAPEWIEYLQEQRRLEAGSVRPMVRNRLVFVASAAHQPQGLIDLSKPVVLLNRLDGGRLAMGDPSHVPAGRYAKGALDSLGLWPAVRDRLALQSNVRAVLAFVERGEAPLGIVYATDIALSERVRVAGVIPGSAHAPISYTSAIVSDRDTPDVAAFYAELTTDTAAEVFQRYGFGVIEKDDVINFQ